MKRNPDFVLNEIDGEFVIIPIGQAAININGVMRVNEVGAFIFRQLSSEVTAEDITNALVSEYEVTKEQARIDVDEFILSLKKIGII